MQGPYDNDITYIHVVHIVYSSDVYACIGIVIVIRIGNSVIYITLLLYYILY